MKSDILEKFSRVDVGDFVETLPTYYIRNGIMPLVGRVFLVTKVTEGYVYDEYGHSYSYRQDRMPFTKSEYWCDVKLKKGDTMNQIIIEMFPQTKDAVLIDKWFGSKINNDPLMAMLIKGKENDLLKEAKRLEEESKNKK